jgi:DNA-binding LytR/AlgR family response regulator
MQKLNCLIVEDERLAAEVLSDYIRDVPGLRLVAHCSDAIAAMEILREQVIDVLFVDIHLPKINGVDFVKTLKGNYQVIFTTAYHQYALEGFKVNATDYLLKPIEFSRFLEAINKAYDRHKILSAETTIHETNEPCFHFFNVDKKQVKVFENEILFIESLKDYVRIHTDTKRLVTKFQIGELENVLNTKQFIRVHKSFIVNTKKITAFSASEIEISAVKIPIGRSYKDSAIALLK